MSFGWSVSDVALLARLAWKTVQNTRRACGEHAELASEVISLHVVLRRLEEEISNPESPLHRPGFSSKEDVIGIVSGCQRPLKILDQIVEKYNALSRRDEGIKILWQKVRFGNGQTVALTDLRAKITYYTSALTLYLNLVSTGSMGRVERQMEDAGEDLKDLKKAVNKITAHLMEGAHHEASVLTSHTNDDKAVWKEFRRGLVKDGFKSSFLRKHKALIQAYFEELGRRGVLDDPEDVGMDLSSFDVPDEGSGPSGLVLRASKVENDSASGKPAVIGIAIDDSALHLVVCKTQTLTKPVPKMDWLYRP